jgi:Zn-dependent protease with chaperone function
MITESLRCACLIVFFCLVQITPAIAQLGQDLIVNGDPEAGGTIQACDGVRFIPGQDTSAAVIATYATDTRNAQSPEKYTVPLSSPQEVDYGDYHLKVSPGWALPNPDASSHWFFRYMGNLRDGPASPVTPLQLSFYIQPKPYSNEKERRATVAQFRSEVWRGTNPVKRSDTMKLAGVKTDRFMQKGDTGWRFYLFPYNGANVYYVYAFSPGDKPALAPEALEVLSSLRIAGLQNQRAAASARQEKAPKDYTKNVGGGFNLFSAGDEREMGQRHSDEMNRQLSLVQNAEVQKYIESVVRRLVAAPRNTQLDCRTFVVNTREVNAFALPGCFLYVNRALIDLAENEGQLAGVMAHEIGHVAGHHAAKQISKQLVLLGIVEGASAVVSLKSEKWANVIDLAGGIGAILASLKYSRDDEHQADALAAETMAAAGYDPHDLVAFFHRMDPAGAPGKAGRIMALLNTHPPTADRETALSQQIAHISYRADAEAQHAQDFLACRNELAGWLMPPEKGEVTLSNALAAVGLSEGSGQEGAIGTREEAQTVLDIDGKTTWMETGVEVKEEQAIQFWAEGELFIKKDSDVSCDPSGVFGTGKGFFKPISSLNTGALIGRIVGGEEGTPFPIGTHRVVRARISGKLQLGINDDNASDNRGLFRVWILTK